MSLSAAIQALRKAVPVPSVPSPENRREPPEALPDKAVPSVPSVPSEKSRIQPRDETAQAGSAEGWHPNAPGPTVPAKPLTLEALAALIAKAARRYGLAPADLWAFLSVEDIEAIRTGSPEEIAALSAFAESRSLTGDTTPGGHDLPFPGAGGGPSEGGRLVRCGDCGHFQPDRVGDGSGIGRCGKGIDPGGGLMYPQVARTCRGFAGHVAADSGP